MHRRDFLTSCGAAVIASRAASPALAQPDPSPSRRARTSPFEGEPVVASADRFAYPTASPRIRKALKYGMIGAGATIEEKFAIARDAGFDGVELPSPSDLDLDEVLRAKDKTGIQVPGVVDSVHWSRPLSHPDPRVRAEGRHALETAARDCRTYDGTTVLLVPAVVNAETSYSDAWERSLTELRRVIPIINDLGVSIAIENVWNNFLLSPLEAARYVDELGSAAPPRDPDAPSPQPRFHGVLQADGTVRRLIGWHLDIGNLVNYAWPEHWIDALGTRILKLDVKGFSRKKRDEEGLWKGFNVAIGEGDVHWPAVGAALDRIGFRGWAAAEVPGGGPDRLREIARRIDRVFRIGAE